MKKINILTLFPDFFKCFLNKNLIKKAIKNKIINFKIFNFRDFAIKKKVDDYTYGGGAGMLLKIQPIYDNLKKILFNIDKKSKFKIILLSPVGKKFTQKIAEEFSKYEYLIFICGHYEGIDYRIKNLITDDISLGNYILSCGEIATMVLIDSIIRLIPGVIKKKSLNYESFSLNNNRLLEYPQYTRPRKFKNMCVPSILLSGNHKKIKEWRLKKSIDYTFKKKSNLTNKKIINFFLKK